MVFDLAYDYDSYFKRDATLKKSDIKDLKKWVETQNEHILIPKDLTEKQLLLFYVACQKNIENTQKCIKFHYNLKNKSPDMFDDRNIYSDDLTVVQQAQEHIYLPVKTDAGYGVVFHRLHDSNADKYLFMPNNKYFTMIIEAKLNEDGPDDGIILLFDMAKAKFAHLTKVPIGELRRYLAYAQEGMSTRIVSIHILNVTTLFSAILQLIKPFMKGELLKRMYVHSSDMDWGAFYRDVIPKKCLPADFGGDLEDTQTLNKRNVEKLSKNQAYFDAEEAQRHNCIVNDKENIKVEKSFSYLSID